MRIETTMIKYTSLPAVLLFALLFAQNTLPAQAQKLTKTKASFIGPEYFEPIPVDSSLLRKTQLVERLMEREKDNASIGQYENTVQLQSLLGTLQTVGTFSKANMSTMAGVVEGYRRSGNPASETLALNTYGVTYARNTEYGKAIDYFSQALLLEENHRNKEGVERYTTILALLYELEGNYDKAVTFNEYNVKINLDLRKKAKAAQSYLELADNYELQKKFSLAESTILRKALPMFTSAGSKEGRMRSFQKLGGLYYRQRRFSEARWFFLQATNLSEKLNLQEANVNNLIKLAAVKSAMGQHSSALADYKQAEALAVRGNYPVTLVEIKGNLGETYGEMGNYALANSALDEYSKLKDVLLRNLNL